MSHACTQVSHILILYLLWRDIRSTKYSTRYLVAGKRTVDGLKLAIANLLTKVSEPF